MEDEEDEDDEETLQLQLQEIQARLRLKKLQKRTKQNSDTDNESTRAESEEPRRSRSVATSRAPSRIAGSREKQLEKSRPQPSIDVPVSPIRRIQPTEMQRSPGRVLLGIDKGLKGYDVSLKRAPSLRRREGSHDKLAGPFLQRPISQASSRALGRITSSQEAPDEDRPKTFSERMAAMREKDAEREARESRIRKNRSMAFDISQEQMKSFKKTAVPLPDGPRPTTEFSRDEVLNGYNKPNGSIPRSQTVPSLRSAMRSTSGSTASSAASSRPESQPFSQPLKKSRSDAKLKETPPGEVSEAEASQFEPYSAQHLSKRIIPHQVLTRTLSGKKTFLIPDLLRTVKGPDFLGPDIEEDVVVFAIIASKSEPKAHQLNSKNQQRGKFMVMTLTDLKWELDLFLFGSAFEKFWKMTPGTIIAILNPLFMAPRPGRADTGKWSLTLNSDADTVLEVGTARDLGFCKTVKRDGSTCDAHIDKRHTEFCDYHINIQLQKTHSQRMEVNSMNFGKGNLDQPGRKQRHVIGSDRLERVKERAAEKKMEQKTRYDKESHSQIYIGKRSTVSMLDDVDFDPDAFHRGSNKEERMTRQILAQEKERELSRKLGMMGDGIGADYAQVRAKSRTTSHHPSRSSNNDNFDGPPPPPDAGALGLLAGKARDVALSPIKRKRTNTVSSSAAVGWGSELSKELGRMKNGENLQPVKKKTRFVTEKGIREAGRESFGGEVVKNVGSLDDSDDDELDIVKE